MDPTFWRVDEGGLPGCPVGTIISLVSEGSTARVMKEGGQVGTLDVSTTTQTTTPGGASITLVNESEGWRAVLSRTTGFAPLGAFGAPVVAPIGAIVAARPKTGSPNRTKIVVGIVVALVILAAIGSVAGAGMKPTTTPLPVLGAQPTPTLPPASLAPSQPPLTSDAPVVSDAPVPTDTPVPTEAPPKLLLTFAGSGIKNSKQFNWDGSAAQVNWSYNCSNFGGRGNFIVDFDSAGDTFGGDGIVNELGPKGSDSTFEYTLNGDPYHLEVNSECKWSIKVYGLP